MIALISSTIYPPDLPSYDGQRTWIDPEDRLRQTMRTVHSLLNVGITEVYLADNSAENWRVDAVRALMPAKVHVFSHHQYQNKGISELYLLLAVLEHIPDSTPLLKISGRYTLDKDITDQLGDADLAVKLYDYGRSKKFMSTRCYMIKNKGVLETFLKRTLRDMYGYPSRIVGLRSLLRIIHNSLSPSADGYSYDDPNGSVEGAAARVLKNYGYKVKLIEHLGVEGLAGAFRGHVVKE